MCDACDKGVGDDPVRFQQWRDQNDAWFRDEIKRSGWAIQFVEADDDMGDWAYTIGLSGFGAPELVVYGLPPWLAAELLNRLGERVRAGAAPPRDGDEVGAGACAVRFFTVPAPGLIILTANRLYGRSPDESLPALQVVWPDAHGVWPWEPGCAAGGAQPMPGTVDAWGTYP